MGQDIIKFLATFIDIFIEIYVWLVIARVILSWFRSKPNSFSRFVKTVTDPIMDLAKKMTPRTGMLDFSPIVAFVGLEVVRWILKTGLVYASPYIIQFFG